MKKLKALFRMPFNWTSVLIPKEELEVGQLNEFWENLGENVLNDPRLEGLIPEDQIDQIKLLLRKEIIVELVKELRWLKKSQLQDLIADEPKGAIYDESNDDKILSFIQNKVSEKKLMKVYSTVKHDFISGILDTLT
jgi:hypothetical protein